MRYVSPIVKETILWSIGDECFALTLIRYSSSPITLQLVAKNYIYIESQRAAC